jgi:hypothetical protein
VNEHASAIAGFLILATPNARRAPLKKVWKMVKKTLAFFGTLPFLRISSGLMRARV